MSDVTDMIASWIQFDIDAELAESEKQKEK